MSSYCPRGQRKNRKTRECEPYIETPPKYSRCPKGQRKDKFGECKQFTKNQNVLKDVRKVKEKIEKLENANHIQNQQIEEQDVPMEQGKIR